MLCTDHSRCHLPSGKFSPDVELQLYVVFSGWILTPIAQSTNGYPARTKKCITALHCWENRHQNLYFIFCKYIHTVHWCIYYTYIIHNTDWYIYIMQVYMHALSASETNQLLQHQPIHFCSCFGRHTSCTCWLRRPVPLLFVRPKTLWVMWAKLLPRTRVGCWIWPSVLRAIVKEIVTGCWWTNYTFHCQFHSTIWKKTRSWKFQFSECRTGFVFLLNHNLWHVTTGLQNPNPPRSEAQWEKFWSLYRQENGNHQIFARADRGEIDLRRTAAILVHGDEGRGRRRQAFFVCSFHSILGKGSSVADRGSHSEASSKRQYCKLLPNLQRPFLHH